MIMYQISAKNTLGDYTVVYGFFCQVLTLLERMVAETALQSTLLRMWHFIVMLPAVHDEP